MFCPLNSPTDAPPGSSFRCPGGIFLFYLDFPSSFGAVCLSTWVFLQVLTPFTVVNLHHTILLVEGHEILQLFNLFFLVFRREK